MTSRLPVAAFAAAVTILLAGCGSNPTPTATPRPSGPSASAAGVLPVPVSSEFRVGANRTVFSLADSTGQKPVAAPDRPLSIGYRGPNGEAIASAPQTFIWAVEGVNGVYIGHAT